MKSLKLLALIVGFIGIAAIAVENQKAAPHVEVSVKPLPDITIGEASAPITLIQYSAFSCSHCAEFHKDVLPKIEDKYVKTGEVRVILRDYPIDNPSLRASQLAWCAGPLRYRDLFDTLLDKQRQWLTSNDPVATLTVLAKSKGIDEEQFKKCLADGELMTQIIKQREEGREKYKIDATPTLVINDKVINYALTFEEFQAIVTPMLKGKTKNKS